MREPVNDVSQTPPLPPQALLERLKDYGQEDAFALWDELSSDERQLLVKDIEVISTPRSLSLLLRNRACRDSEIYFKCIVVDFVKLMQFVFVLCNRAWIFRESIGSFGARFDLTVSYINVSTHCDNVSVIVMDFDLVWIGLRRATDGGD